LVVGSCNGWGGIDEFLSAKEGATEAATPASPMPALPTTCRRVIDDGPDAFSLLAMCNPPNEIAQHPPEMIVPRLAAMC
jgi:hypothetical protein